MRITSFFGADVLGVQCDVSDKAQVEALAITAYEHFGNVHFLANNAGVVSRHKAWEGPDDWDWVLGIDLMGVIYGVQSFVPRMLASGEPGHIMNTASTAGLLAFPGIASYNVAKRGVVALSETLHHEFAKLLYLSLFFAQVSLIRILARVNAIVKGLSTNLNRISSSPVRVKKISRRMRLLKSSFMRSDRISFGYFHISIMGSRLWSRRIDVFLVVLLLCHISRGDR